MLGDKCAKLADEAVGPAGSELRVEKVLQDVEPPLLEPELLGAREREGIELRERRSSPQSERLAELRRASRRLELLCRVDQRIDQIEVQLPGLDPELVPAAAGQQSIRAELTPEPGDVILERARGRVRRPVLPDRLDQFVRRDRAVCMQEEICDHRPPRCAAERERSAALRDLERPKDPELHYSTLALSSRGEKPCLLAVCWPAVSGLVHRQVQQRGLEDS